MQSAKNVEILERALMREKAARKAAEAILEQKSLELYNVSEELRQTNSILEETHLPNSTSFGIPSPFGNFRE